MTMYNLTTSQADRINLDEFAARCGYEDAREIVGNINVRDHANELVDLALENESLTDDPEEYRARFVDAYEQAFDDERLAIHEREYEEKVVQHDHDMGKADEFSEQFEG